MFDRVQAVLAEQCWAGNRDRKWDHYLKGSLWCSGASKRQLAKRYGISLRSVYRLAERR